MISSAPCTTDSSNVVLGMNQSLHPISWEPVLVHSELGSDYRLCIFFHCCHTLLDFLIGILIQLQLKSPATTLIWCNSKMKWTAIDSIKSIDVNLLSGSYFSQYSRMHTCWKSLETILVLHVSTKRHQSGVSFHFECPFATWYIFRFSKVEQNSISPFSFKHPAQIAYRLVTN